MENDQQDIKLPHNRLIALPEFYTLVMNSIHDYAIFTTDTNLIINSWGAGSPDILGYQAEEAIGQHGEIIFTEEDKRNGVPLQEKERTLREGKSQDNRWHVNKEGKLFFAFGQMFPLKDENEEVVGFVKILRDLTERKMAEDAINKYVKELEELLAHKENILAILSHDLRSPLSSIVGIAQLLKSDMDQMSREEISRLHDFLYQASMDELSMLDYLLEWARVKYASEVFSPQSIELTQVVEKIFEKFAKMSENVAVRLISQVPQGINVYADKNMLLSILQNLVSNAIKFTPPGGNVTVSAAEEDEQAVVKVKDTGIGIPRQMLDNLFKPHVKTLSQARKRNEGGGIGLLLVKGFVERNNGKIWAESVEGQGTTFHFTLPVNETSLKKKQVSVLE